MAESARKQRGKKESGQTYGKDQGPYQSWIQGKSNQQKEYQLDDIEERSTCSNAGILRRADKIYIWRDYDVASVRVDA
jgi:hypothetical protein